LKTAFFVTGSCFVNTHSLVYFYSISELTFNHHHLLMASIPGNQGKPLPEWQPYWILMKQEWWRWWWWKVEL